MAKDYVGLLSWGSQYGDRISGRAVEPFDRQLHINAHAYDGKKYFRKLRCLNITWRVAGEINDFEGGEGPERMRYWRKEHFIGIDMVIPVKAWKLKSNAEILEYILKQLRACFDLLVARALKEGEVLDENVLRNDIELLLSDYERDCQDLPPINWPYSWLQAKNNDQ